MKNSKYEFLTFSFSIGENSLIIGMRSLACLLINFKSQIYIVLTIFIQLFISDKVCSLAWMKDSLVVEDLHFVYFLNRVYFRELFDVYALLFQRCWPEISVQQQQVSSKHSNHFSWWGFFIFLFCLSLRITGRGDGMQFFCRTNILIEPGCMVWVAVKFSGRRILHVICRQRKHPSLLPLTLSLSR